MADDYVTRVISVELIRSLGHYEGKGALIIGVVQVLLGVWSLALGIAHCLTQTILFGDVGYGIWGGVVYIIAGICGILSKKKSMNLIVAHMVMSIIAAVLASLQFCLGVSAAYFDHKHILEGLPEGPYSGTVVVDCLLAVVGISEAILATAAAALGCKVTCCNNKFLAAQQELDNPQVRTYHVNESYKYVVNPERL